jgi:hypothetical protein
MMDEQPFDYQLAAKFYRLVKAHIRHLEMTLDEPERKWPVYEGRASIIVEGQGAYGSVSFMPGAFRGRPDDQVEQAAKFAAG